MENYNYFELHRLSDNLVYQFDRKELSNGKIAYKRRDQDLWINYKPELGWIAYDEENQELYGRSWNVLPENQHKDHPPEGIWVSRKDIKSYVYELKYIQN